MMLDVKFVVNNAESVAVHYINVLWFFKGSSKSDDEG